MHDIHISATWILWEFFCNIDYDVMMNAYLSCHFNRDQASASLSGVSNMASDAIPG